MKTIFITVFHSFISKNILNTEAFKILSKDKNIKIILFVPKNKEIFYRETYGSLNVFIEGIDLNILSERVFNWFSRFLVYSNYLHYKKVEKFRSRKTIVGNIKFHIEVLFTKCLGDIPFLFKIYRFLYIKISRKNSAISNYFEKYKPDILFSTDIFTGADSFFMKEARRNNIKIIGMVRSWDNCYSKGLLKVVPDRFIVNNETLKDELLNKQHVGDVQIFVSGLPQFDQLINEKRKTKKQFFEDINVKSLDKKLVLFAPAGSILSDTDWQICDILNDAIKNNKIKKNIHILSRNHPGHPADLSLFSGSDNFTLEDPGYVFNKNNPKDTELTVEGSKHLADTLYNADLVIWVATTLGIDAAVFDKPQIVINFDGFEGKDYYDSVKKYHDEDHMKKMLDLGGVTTVNNQEELIYWINKYLENPLINQDKRKLMVEQQIWKLDGKSGERIGNFLLKELKKKGKII